MNIRKLMLALIALLVIAPIALPAGKPAPKPARQPAQQEAPAAVDEEFYDLLVLGVDKRPGDKNGRSDVIMIIHCEPKRVTMFSIPRDTVVKVRGHRDKINAGYSYGNIDLAKKTIEGFLRFKVDNYIVLNLQTFLKTIDAIKALTDNGRLIGAENFLVSGDNLLKWLRWRYLPQGDRRRCQRHQIFMKRVYEYANGMYVDQRGLFEQCVKGGLKIAQSDLTYEHIASLFGTYQKLDLEKDVEQYVLPGVDDSEWETDAEGKRVLKGYYYKPKYNWSLMNYLRWFRKNNMRSNYVEEDTLRK